MRTTLVLAAVAVLVPRAVAQDAPALDDWAARATHILVVDARGFVLDVWKGDAAPGEVIPLDGLFSDPGCDPRDVPRLREPQGYRYTQPPRHGATVYFLVKPPRLKPAPPVPELVYGYWGSRQDELPPNPLADVGAAAFARVCGLAGYDPHGRGSFSSRYSWTPRRVPSRGGWLPANRLGGIEGSMAVLDDAGLLRVPDRAPSGPGRAVEQVGAVPRWSVVGTAEHFRWRIDEARRAEYAAGW